MLSINTNQSSLFAQRMYGQTESVLGRAMQRLSSGVRINSAADDAAGLAVSNRMTSQVRGLNQSVRNMNDGISLLQTAEGAMQEVTNMLQRGRELAVQAANGSLNASDRDSLQAEVSQLLKEIDRVAQTTSFNGTKVLDNGTGKSLVGDEKQLEIVAGLKSGWLEQSEQRISQYFKLSADNVTFNVNFVDDSGNGYVAWVLPANPDSNRIAQSVDLTIDLSDYPPSANGIEYDRIIAHEMAHAVMAVNMDFTTAGVPSWFKEGTAEFIAGADERLLSDISQASGGNYAAKVADLLTNNIAAGANVAMTTSAQYSAGYAATRFLHAEIKAAGGTGIDELMVQLRDNPGASFDAALGALKASHSSLNFDSESTFLTRFQGATGQAFVAGMNLTNSDVGAIGGFDADGGPVTSGAAVIDDTVRINNNPLTGFVENWPEVATDKTLSASALVQLQVGAFAGQTIDVSMGAVDTISLNVNDIDISANAQLAIEKLDRALAYVNEQRGSFGAAQNRLEYGISVANNTAENISAARSRILDADIAAETAVMTRRNILSQANVSVMAQANQLPQLALQLLG